MDNINKYRASRGLKPLTESEMLQFAKEAVEETERFQKRLDEKNHRNRIDHYDRFGNFHMYD